MCPNACSENGGPSLDLGGLMGAVREALAEHGIDFDACCTSDDETDPCKPRVKVVCVAPDLQASAREMGKAARDQVVMVRVDAQTAERLDAWVQTGAVKSRSEAAALFIREGLKVRASELDRLAEALRDVKEARERLEREAREVFGGQADDPEASNQE